MGAPMIYELRRPNNAIPGKQYPALFMMHGMGSNEQDLLSLVDGFEDSFYIFSIRGHLTQGSGFSFFSIEGFGRPHREVFDEAINKLTSFIDYACEKYPLDLSRIYLLGFSQGAIVSMTLALTLGSKIKGTVALSGYIPKFVKEEYKINAKNQLSVFISHGEYDPALPFEWGQESADYFSKLGIPVTFRSYPAGHTVTEKNLHDLQEWILTDLQR
jgi:phospholipase/carboxylesterase